MVNTPTSNLGLCLSGGGTRGIAHLGVLQAMQEHYIEVEYLSGASAGAIIGTLYASGISPTEILTIFKESSLTRLFKVSLPSLGLTDNTYIVDMLKELVGKDDFSQLKKKMFISVTNINKGCFEIVSEGPLFDIVAASASIPILFKPKEINGHIYADGGLLNNLPIEPLKSHCNHIIGVNVTPIDLVDDIDNMIDIAYRSLDLIMWNNVKPRLEQCDIVIEPDTDKYGFFDLKKADEIYLLGYEAAMRTMPQIKTLTQDVDSGY